MGGTSVMSLTLIAILIVLPLYQSSPSIGLNHTLSRVRRQKCRFNCLSGECIGEGKFKCDGTKDCDDGSDETAAACMGFPCPSYAVTCEYGACVDGDSWCNGRIDCPDESDEKYCNKTEPTTGCTRHEFRCTSGTCISIFDQCDGSTECDDGSDETKEACQNFKCQPFSFKCDYGACIDRNLQCDGVSHCRDGSDENLPMCELVSRTPPDVTPSTLQPNTATRVCGPNGPFQPPVSSECGRFSSPPGIPFILHGNDTTPGEFPWHAAIFKSYDGGTTYVNICGGTLVSLRLVISAAHCFWDAGRGRPDEPVHYKIALGKYHGNWAVKDRDEKIFDVERIQVDCFYNHNEKFYDDDIAAITLQRKVQPTKKIRPVCIDWGREYQSKIDRGVVPGWGLNETYKSPENLKKVILPLVEINTCFKALPVRFATFLSRGKFCAGYNTGTGVCNGDSGGGLVFEENDSWYLRGIVSVGVKNSSSPSAVQYCSLSHYALFTDIYQYLPWLSVVYS